MKVWLSLIAVMMAGFVGPLWHGDAPVPALAGPTSSWDCGTLAFRRRILCGRRLPLMLNSPHCDTGSEFTIWMTRDPHAKAYEVLFTRQSAQIQKNRHANMQANLDMRCLKCHVSPELDADLDKAAAYTSAPTASAAKAATAPRANG